MRSMKRAERDILGVSQNCDYIFDTRVPVAVRDVLPVIFSVPFKADPVFLSNNRMSLIYEDDSTIKNHRVRNIKFNTPSPKYRYSNMEK